MISDQEANYSLAVELIKKVNLLDLNTDNVYKWVRIILHVRAKSGRRNLHEKVKSNYSFKKEDVYDSR